MSMIEGIGDEVIHFFAIVIVVFLSVLAWWSTYISEGPLIRTVLILERRSRSRTTNDSSHPQQSITSDENSIDTGQHNTNGIQELVETEVVDSSDSGDDKEESESSSSLLLPSSQPAATIEVNGGVGDGQNPELSPAQPSTPQICQNRNGSRNADTETSVLRWRRLTFFQSRGPTLLESMDASDDSSDVPTTERCVSNGGDSSVQPETEEVSSGASPDQIRIRLKYLNDDQIVVEGRLQEQLGDFKRRHFSIELAAEKMVRLIFNGQVLQSDSQTLQGYGLFDNCVVHCLVHNQRNNASHAAHTQNSGSSSQSSPPDWNLGTLLYTCLSVILGFAWYCRYQYSHLFTVTTTAALFGLTGMFVVTLLSVYLPDHEIIQ